MATLQKFPLYQPSSQLKTTPPNSRRILGALQVPRHFVDRVTSRTAAGSSSRRPLFHRRLDRPR